MIITKMLGITFNEYGQTENTLPSNWTEIKLDNRKKSHRKAIFSKMTRLIVRLKGWGFSDKRGSVPILSYYTDSPEMVRRVIEYGDMSNAELFIHNGG